MYMGRYENVFQQWYLNLMNIVCAFSSLGSLDERWFHTCLKFPCMLQHLHHKHSRLCNLLNEYSEVKKGYFLSIYISHNWKSAWTSKNWCDKLGMTLCKKNLNLHCIFWIVKLLSSLWLVKLCICRHEWYQTLTHLVVSIFAKGIKEEDLKVNFGEQIVSFVSRYIFDQLTSLLINYGGLWGKNNGDWSWESLH